MNDRSKLEAELRSLYEEAMRESDQLAARALRVRLGRWPGAGAKGPEDGRRLPIGGPPPDADGG